MKREYLFRGKTKDSGRWITGNLINLSSDNYAIRFKVNDVYFDVEIIPETIGQFTGLKDKNKKKIFEGDVVFNKNRTLLTCKEDARTYLVKWVDGEYREESNGITWLYQKPSFVFSKIQGSGLKYMDLVFSQEQIEIIGNIHDNPELLK